MARVGAPGAAQDAQAHELAQLQEAVAPAALAGRAQAGVLVAQGEMQPAELGAAARQLGQLQHPAPVPEPVHVRFLERREVQCCWQDVALYAGAADGQGRQGAPAGGEARKPSALPCRRMASRRSSRRRVATDWSAGREKATLNRESLHKFASSLRQRPGGFKA